MAALEADPAFVTMQAHLSDRFGDLGMIAVLTARAAEHGGETALEIDTWLMSCRVLGRQVEEAMFSALLDAAQARGVGWLIGEYAPTPKNGPVADLLTRLGFAFASESGGRRRHCLRMAEAPRPEPPMHVQIG